MIKKKIKMLKVEYLKRSAFIKQEWQGLLLKFLLKNEDLRSSKYILARAHLMRKKKKKKSISYHTSFCVQTGHQKSRINWGKLSRFAFKSTANKNNFSFLVKKSQ
jgi:ribosomal protein S14